MLLQRSVINKLAGGILLFEVVKRSAVPLGLGPPRTSSRQTPVVSS